MIMTLKKKDCLNQMFPETRVLVDRYADSDEISKGHRTLFFDIEVKVTEGFQVR